jgi:hypothetical protein
VQTLWSRLIREVNTYEVGDTLDREEIQKKSGRSSVVVCTTTRAYYSKLIVSGFIALNNVLLKKIPEDASSMDPTRRVSNTVNGSEGFLNLVRVLNNRELHSPFDLNLVGDVCAGVSDQSLLRYMSRLVDKDYVSRTSRFQYRLLGRIPEDLRVADPIDWRARRESSRSFWYRDGR